MKKILAMLLAVMMVLSLAACGAKAPAEEPAPAPEADAPAADAPAADAPAEEPAAELEDSLVIYTSMTQDDLDALIPAFNAVYPDIEVEVVNGSQGELMARIAAEVDDPQGDMMWNGLADTDAYTNEAYFEKWQSEYVSEYMDGYKDYNDMYSMDIVSAPCLAVNTKLEAELGLNITSYADLLDPKLEGKIVMADPNSSSSAWNNVCNMIAVFGVDTPELWDYVEKLMKNIKIVDSSSVTFNSVVDGEYVVGISYESGAIKPVMNGAEDFEIRYFDEGNSGTVFGSAMIKNCKHPNAAKAMIDFITSGEGQTAVLEANNGTIRFINKNHKSPADPYLIPSDQIKWIERPVEEIVAAKEAILTHWNESWAAING